MESFFGVQASINVKGKKRSTSRLGVLLTVFLVGGLVIAAIIFGRDLVERKYPTIIPSVINKALVDTPMVIDPDKMSFFVARNSDYKYFVDDSIYLMQAYYFRIQKFWIKLVYCEPKPGDMTEGTKWCFDKDPENLKYVNLGNPDVGRLSVRIMKCDNTTSKVPCQPPEVIDSVLSKSFVGISMMDIAINSSNHGHALSEVWYHLPKSMPMTTTKLLNIYMKGIEFTTDNGWLTTAQTVERANGVELVQNDFGPLAAFSGALYQFQIYNGANLYTYQRSYTKIQDVLAQISGVMSALMLVCGTVAYKYSNFKMYERLAKDLYRPKAQTSKPRRPHSRKYRQKYQPNTKANREVLVESAYLETMSVKLKQLRGEEIPKEDKEGKEEQPANHSLPLAEINGDSFDDFPNDDLSHSARANHVVLHSPTGGLSEMLSEGFSSRRSPVNDPLILISQQTSVMTENPLPNSSPRKPEPSKFKLKDLSSKESKSMDSPVFLPIITDPSNKEKVKEPPFNQYESEEIETQELEKEKNLSVKQRLSSAFKSMKQRYSYVDKAAKEIDSNLDVVMISRKFHQMEYLTRILLNDEQKFVLENLPKPHLAVENPKNVSVKPEEMQARFKKVIKELAQKDQLSSIDVKLLDLYYDLLEGKLSK